MSLPATPAPTNGFSPQELALLASTADAMTAYLGQPVLAETGITEDGVAWIVFGIPLPSDAADEDDTLVRIQMGGENVQWIGNAGGLSPGQDDVFDCRYLWAIQITQEEGERFVKLDEQGEAAAWSDRLADLLPFAIDERELLVDDDDDDEDEGDEDEGEYDRDRDGKGKQA